MRILIVVTHLLGAGHLKRSINLAQAFARAGHVVTLASGGFPVRQFDTQGIAVLQLPPIGSDGTNFSCLLQSDGSPVTENHLASREQALVNTVHRGQPDVLITELFPFGRRSLKREFLALLEASSSLSQTPLVLASVRDILSPPSSEKKAAETELIIDKFYDGVLVHSDQRSTPLDMSWPLSGALSAKLHYTGYVTPVVNADRASFCASLLGLGEILVSAGGGGVGRHVFETAISSARLTAGVKWRLLVGGAEAEKEVDRLQKLNSAATVVVEAVRPDFRELLQNAMCSVSLCGYNTAIDLLQTGTPGVLIPFDEGGEQEQVLRAKSLSNMPSFELIPAADLTPQRLVDAIASVCEVGRVKHSSLRFDGATQSVRIVTGLIENRV